MLLPATPGWVSLPLVVGGPRHSWLGSAGGGGLWCVVCGGGVLVGLWLVCGVVGPSPLLAVVRVCYSPPLLAGFRCRWWWAVPATPGWGPLAALLCGVWCVAVVCWWGCGWCVVWLVPRHSWRRFLCATPRHSWLGFAAAGGGRSPPLLAGVRWRRCCVVCGVWRWCVVGVVASVWCGWSLATPGGGSFVLLPATPGWVSLPLVVGGPRHSWLGSAGGGGVWCVVCGVWRWCVVGVLVGVWCGWSLATPGGGSCVLLPATPGWVSLPPVVGGPRHSWLGSAGGGGVWCVVCGGGVLVGLWLVCGVVGPSPLLAVVPVCYSPPLLAGFRCRWWWAVPATPGWGPLAAVVCGGWCVVCGGGVLLGLWLLCGVVGPSPLLAEVPVCYSPPLLAGFRCRWWWAVPATPGWGPLAAVVCRVWCVVCGVWCVGGVPRHSWRWFVCATPRHSWLGFAAAGGGRSPPLLAGVRLRRWCVVCGVWCVAVVCCWGCGWCVVWLVPRHSWRRFLCATPRHSWLGFAAAGGGRSPPLLAGVRWRRWCVVCGVWRWCVVGVVVGVWCGWFLATPGGGPCVLLPATPGWVSLPVVVGGPRHSWLGSVGGGGVWCVVCGVWCVVCGVLMGSLATPGGVPVCYSPPLLAGFRCRWWWAVPATPGWGPLAAVLCGVWCVAVVCCWGCGWCVVWLVPRHSWLGFAAAGGGRSPPIVDGVRWRRWCVVCGVWRWCVAGVVAGVWCGWSLATPGGGSCVLLPATPGWVSLPLVVGGPRHSWLGSAGGGGVWCVVCGVWCVVCWWGPSPLLAVVRVCYSPPLLAGVRLRRWCVVCGVWCVAVVCCWGCGWCVVWLVPRHSWRRFLCATPPHSWLGFAAAGGGRSPPLLAGVRWRRWCVVCGVWRWCVVGVVVGVWCGWFLAIPGGGPCVLLPATPGWVSLPVVVGGPRHSWLGSVGGGGVWCVVCGVWCVVCGVLVGSLATPGGVPVCYSPPLLAGFRCRWWWAVPATPGWGPLAAVVCGVVAGRALVLPDGGWCACVFVCVRYLALAGRPPGRVLVRLTFSFGRFVFLLCLAPSGLGLPPSLSLLLPFPVGCFSRPPAAWLSVRSRLVCVSRLAVGCSLVVAPPPPSPLVSRGFRCSCLVPWCFFFSFFFFLCAPPLSPAFSGFRPRVPWASALALFALLAFRFSALRALVPLSCFPPGCWLLPCGCCPPPHPLCVSRFSFLPLGAVCRVVLCVPGCGAAPRCCALCRPVLCCRVLCCARLVPLLVAPCPLALPVALGPCALRRCVLRCSPALCALCCVCFVVAWWCVLLFAALPCAVCVSGCCAVRSLCSPFCAVLCFAVLVRSRCAVRVVRAVAGAWCCGALLCVVLFPVVCRGAVLGLVARGCLLVACFGVVSLSGRVVCFPVVGVVFCGALLSCVVFCGAVLSRGAVLLCSAVVLRCCWGLLCPPVGCRAVLCCAVGWLCCFWPGGGVCVLRCSFPRAVRFLSSPLCALRCLVVLAVVPCLPVSCAVALCCRVVLCCRALLSFCGAVCVCFALLRPVVRRQCGLRCCWCLVLWRVPVRCGVSLGVLRCGGAALVCRGVLLCCALSCGVLRPVPCPAVPCCPAVLCWLAVLCGCLRCWCLFFLLSSFPLLKTPAVFPCL